jgi:hypothetical protein
MNYDPKKAAQSYRRAQRRNKRRPHWKDYLVPALARAICQDAGYDGFTLSGPFGLCCRVGINFLKGGQDAYCLEVCNPDLEKGTLQVTDYGQSTNEFRSGTIGAANGMNHPNILVTPEMTAAEVLRYGCEA